VFEPAGLKEQIPLAAIEALRRQSPAGDQKSTANSLGMAGAVDFSTHFC
jgi:hypothetical protein